MKKYLHTFDNGHQQEAIMLFEDDPNANYIIYQNDESLEILIDGKSGWALTNKSFKDIEGMTDIEILQFFLQTTNLVDNPDHNGLFLDERDLN